MKTSLNAISSNRDPVVGRKYIPKDIQEHAKEYEADFIELMLQQMDKTTPGNNSDDDEDQVNAGEKEYYKNLLLKEHSQLIASKDGGLGMQKMILDQVYPELKRNKFQYEAYQKMHDGQMRPTTTIMKKTDSAMVNEESVK